MCILHAKPLVEFDVQNKEHLHAYKMLVVDGKQHPHWRFHLNEKEHISVPNMMERKIALQHLSEKGLL